MDIQEAKRIEKTVELAVVKAVRANIRVVVHQAVHQALGSELVETDVTPKTPSKRSLRKTATRLLDREVRNGVLSPMPGGLCWAVWLELDALHAKGKDNLEELRKVSDRKKWNWNNSRTEFYRWKHFYDLPLH